MASIVLDLNSDLTTTGNLLDINVATDSSITVHSNGLYASAPNGVNGSSSPGFVDGTWVGLTVKQSIVSVDSTVHKLFTATDAEGQNLTNFRVDIDNLFPGDMYRVSNGTNYDYYMITNVSSYRPNYS